MYFHIDSTLKKAVNENEDVLSSNPAANSLSLLATCCFLTPQLLHPDRSSTFLHHQTLCAASPRSLLCSASCLKYS